MTKRQAQDTFYINPRSITRPIHSAIIDSVNDIRGRFFFYEVPLIRSMHNFGDLEVQIKSRLTSIHN